MRVLSNKSSQIYLYNALRLLTRATDGCNFAPEKKRYTANRNEIRFTYSCFRVSIDC